MMELLGTVAIIAIVAAIAFPAFASIQTSFEMTRLDQTAKQIYLAAQDRATALQSSGRLTALESDIGSDAKIDLASNPAVYTYDNSSKVGLYHVAKGDSAVSEYLVTSAADAGTAGLPGNFIIEISPSTGEVYSVFYSEKTDLDYSSIAAMARDRTSRTPDRIGYYGGERVSDAIDRHKKSSLKDTSVTVVNGEELYIKLQSGAFGDADLKTMTINVDLYKPTAKIGEDDPLQTLSYDASKLGLSANSDELDIILDSMRDGLAFSQIVNQGVSSNSDRYIYPGTDFGIGIRIEYGQEYTFSAGSVNSLYEKVGMNDNRQTAYLSSLRHLNNLRMSKISTLTWGKNVCTAAIVDADIDFNDASWARDSVSIQSREGAVSAGRAINPLTSFAPLDTLNNWGGIVLAAGQPFDGGGHKLSNFNIGVGTSGTGLFSRTGAHISNIKLVDCKVAGGDYTGALVGYLDTAGSVDSCGVYLEKQTAARDVYRVTGGEYVGGLVGYCSGSSSGGISDSFAAIDVQGSSIVGGLVGDAEQWASDCYASGDVTATGSSTFAWSSSPIGVWAGGFAGMCVGASNCYATGNVHCDNQAGSFAGWIGNWGARELYGYGVVLNSSGTGIADNSYGFAGTYSSLHWSSSQCHYLVMPGYNDSYGNSWFSSESYSDLVVSKSLFSSHPYSSALIGQSFPFADTAHLGDHYGDWPYSVNITFYRDTDGVVLQSVDMLAGAIPSYTAKTANYLGLYTRANTSYRFLKIFRFWTINGTDQVDLQPVYKDTAYIGYYDSSPLPILDVATKESGFLTSSFVTARVNPNGKTVDTIFVDSGATGSNPSGATAGAVNGYVQNTLGLDPNAFSWCIYVSNNTYLTAGDIGTQPNGTYQGCFFVLMGDRIPAYGTSGALFQKLDVVKYDYGRATRGLDPYIDGRVTLMVSSSFPGYYSYNIASFSATSDWYSLDVG